VAATPVYSVNLVSNPSFAGNLNDWVVGSGTSFDPLIDATGVPGSGSARNTATVTVAGTHVAISQCIATGPGTYTFGGKIFDPPGPGVSANGVLRVRWFSGSDCTTGFLSSTLITGTGVGFVTLSVAVNAPAGTTHALVIGENTLAGAGTNVTYFDDFVLDNGLASSVPTLGPFALIALFVLLAGMGLAVLLKR
jgi:hypothetical protein